MTMPGETNWYFFLLKMSISGFKRSSKFRSCSIEVQEEGRTDEMIDTTIKMSIRGSDTS